MGYGIITEQGKSIRLETLGVLKLSKYPTHELKLKKIFEKVLALIDEYHPDAMAIEAQFFGKNVQSMLKLGRAQGVAIAASLYREVPVFEYTTTRIKQSITGAGRASKEQVAAMLMRLLGIKEYPEYLDATDGLAAAVCHSFQKSGVEKSEKFTGWEAFLKQNPGRVK